MSLTRIQFYPYEVRSVMAMDLKQQTEFVNQLTRHQAALQNYIVSLMPGLNVVSEVLQETNLVLWEKRHKFEPGTNFRAWAFAIARFEVKAARRRWIKLDRPMLSLELTGELAEETQESSEQFDERMSALARCLGRLDEPQRQLIEHRYYSNKTLEGFAEECGRSVVALRGSLLRIRAALRKCIDLSLQSKEPSS